jgi:hypothetical protein
MADKSLLEQMLERLVNDDQAKAEELFHEYVVAKSREIYENLIESELSEEEAEDEDEEVEESTDADDEDDLEENFEDIAFEADDEMDMDGPKGDMGDDLESELDGEEDLGDKEPGELFQDLNAIVDELQAKFDAQGMGGDDEGDEGGNPFAKEEDFDQLETVREYVEKVPGGHGAEKKGTGEGQYSGTGTQSDKVSLNSKSIVAGKNDMGGTASNIAQSKEDAVTLANQGQLKGSSLFKGTPKEDNAGNINVPGGNAGKTGFKKKEPGHGAEKKGQGEGQFSGKGGSAGSTETASLFRGRR